MVEGESGGLRSPLCDEAPEARQKRGTLTRQLARLETEPRGGYPES